VVAILKKRGISRLYVVLKTIMLIDSRMRTTSTSSRIETSPVASTPH